MGKTDGDYYTLDDMFVSKAAERGHFGKEEENQRKKAIAEHQSLAAQMEKCLYCFDSSQFPKHLIVAIGIKVRNITFIVLRKQFSSVGRFASFFHTLMIPKESAFSYSVSDIFLFQGLMTHDS